MPYHARMVKNKRKYGNAMLLVRHISAPAGLCLLLLAAVPIAAEEGGPQEETVASPPPPPPAPAPPAGRV